MAAAELSLLSSINNYLSMMSAEETAQTAMLQEILTAVSSGGVEGKKSGVGKLAEAGKSVPDFKQIAEGITSLTKGLMVFWIAEKTGATNAFINFLNKFFKSEFLETDENLIQKTDNIGKALHSLGTGIFKFSAMLALSAPLIMIGIVGIPALMLALGGLGIAFKWLSADQKNIQAGIDSLEKIGIGIGILGLALWGFQALLGGFGNTIKAALMAGAAIGIIGLAFSLIGNLAPKIKDGADAMLWTGIAIGGLALGLLAFKLVAPSMSDILITAAAIALIGISFGIIGIFAPAIDAGASAMLLTGVAIASVALGIFAFRLLNPTMEEILIVAGAIIGVGAAFALAGLAAPLILPGAAAIALAGLSLIILSVGLLVIGKLYKDFENGILADSGVPRAIFPGTKSNLENVLDAVSYSFLAAGASAVLMIPGAVALILAGTSMLFLSVGLLVLNKVYKGAMDGLLARSETEKRSAIFGGGSKYNLEVMIDAISVSFSSAANPLMILGAAGIMVTSIAMVLLSGGIFLVGKAWDKFGGTLFGDSGEVGFFGGKKRNFEVMMDSIVDGFTVNPITLAAMYTSIPALLMAGAALITIGKGLEVFMALKVPDQKTLTDRLTTVLFSVQQAFAAAGGYKEGAGLFANIGGLIGGGIKNQFIKQGIDSVRDVGGVLVDLAKGIHSMAELKFPEYGPDGKITGYFTLSDDKFVMVSNNIKRIITSIAGTLIEVGKMDQGGGWFSKSDAEKGKAAIQGVGGDLAGIAQFVQGVANLSFPKYDKDGKEIGRVQISESDLAQGGKVHMNIVNMLKAVTYALATIGGDDAAAKTTLFGFDLTDSTIDKGKEVIAGIGNDLNGIANLVKNVADIQNFDEVEKRLNKLPALTIGIIKGIGDSYDPKSAVKFKMMNSMFSGFTQSIIDLSDKSNPLEKVAGSIQKMSKGFVDMFKSIEKLSANQLEKVSDMWKSLTAFSNANFDNFSEGANKGIDTLNKVNNTNVRSSQTTQGETTTITAEKVTPSTISDKKKLDDQRFEMQKMQYEEMAKKYDETNKKLDMLIQVLSGKLKVVVQD